MAQVQKAEVHLRVAEEAPPVEHGEQAEIIRFPEQLILLAKRKSFILKFVGVAAILSVITVFLLPKDYTPKTKIMPPHRNQSVGASAAVRQPMGAMPTLAI